MAEAHPRQRWILAAAVGALAVSALALWWFSPAEQQKRHNDALIVASRVADVKAIEAALNQGADVNGRDRDGITPLMHAARGDRPNIREPAATDHPDAVRLLIQRGANPNARTEPGFVALLWAARYGHDGVAKVLIDHGADVRAKDKDGLTALRWADTNQQTKVVALLRAAGANE
ncbi:MAG TPA: ankyrin repeat domain-containing protein [Isosphaeraceae bacterium]|jgi:ankyrin repeat protein|nr:ankyrin repeat domain-containing protein [Isosphaeraceae bacterium]